MVIGVVLVTLIMAVWCVYRTSSKKEVHEVEQFEMTENPVYDKFIHTTSNSAYASIHPLHVDKQL